jgi:hypothetical protein
VGEVHRQRRSASVREELAQEYLFDPVLDGDTAQDVPSPRTRRASNFFSPCILRLAAVAKIYGAEQADWLRARIPDSIFVEPILVNPGDISHVNGDNWSRAFGLWWIYQVTNQETVRANSLRILVDHFAQPTHWDITAAYDVSHWVAQYAVRLIDSSYEPNVPVTTPKLPLQLALGNSWALGGTGPLVNPNGLRRPTATDAAVAARADPSCRHRQGHGDDDDCKPGLAPPALCARLAQALAARIPRFAMPC